MISPDAKTRKILESYFGLGIGAEDSLLAELETEHLAGGDWLFRQGDAGDSFYFLIRGRLQVWIDTGDDASPRMLGEVAPGETVGEIGLLTGDPRSAGVQAIRDSMLIKVGRAAFDRLAQSHPQLVMRLAGTVASVLQQRTAKGGDGTRGLSTIAVLPLNDSPRCRKFADQLAEALARQGSTLAVAADDLGSKGAPVERLGGDEPVPQSLVKWLQDRESETRFLFYRCEAADNSWSRYAVRQSDLVVLVADAGSDAAPRGWERQLISRASGALVKRLLILLQDSKDAIADTAAWLSPREVDYHAHVCDDRSGDVDRVARMISGEAIGLVLAGGAARGFAHLGVFRALAERGIPIDWVGGTSIGAIMGASIVVYNWDWERTIADCRTAFVGTRPFSDYTLPLMSLVSGKRAERLFRQFLDARIEDLSIPFFCVSTKLDDGSLNLHESGDLPKALRASASMPGIFPPAIIDGRLTIDGAVLNNMPVDIMKRRPVGKVIAVDLSSQKTYRVDYEALPSAWSVLRGRILPFGRRHRVPSLVTTILKATEVGTLERMRELGNQADLLLHPPVRSFGMTDVKSFDRIVEAGYQYAREALADWG